MRTGNVASGIVASALAVILIASATSVRATLFPSTVVANDIPSPRLLNASVAVGPDETIHIVWEDYRAGAQDSDIWYSRSVNGGLSFGPPIRVTDMGGVGTKQRYPSIAVDGSDTAHVVWTDMRNLNTPGIGPVYYAHSIDQGGIITFTPNAPIAQQPTGWGQLANAIRARIVYDGSAGCALHVVWSNFDIVNVMFDFGVWYDKSSDCGVNWGTDVRIAPGSGRGFDASIDVAPDGTVGVVYVGTFTPYNTCLMMRDTAGWHPPILVTNAAGPYGTKEPVVAMESLLMPGVYVVHVAWADGRNINPNIFLTLHDWDIYYSRGTGTVGSMIFAPGIRVNEKPLLDLSEQAEPQIVSDPAGNPRIAWTDWRSDPDGHRNPQGGPGTQDADVYFRESFTLGTTFAAEIQLQHTQKEQSKPMLSMLPCASGPCGGTYVVWNDERTTPGSYDARLAVPDFDEDGLSDWEERNSGIDGYLTNPLNPDSDHDGLMDGTEVGITGFDLDPSTNTDPTYWDTDGDTLPDGWIDTDSDGLCDPGECEDRDLNGAQDTGPWNAGAGPGETNPLNKDTESDGFDDNGEVVTGVHLSYVAGPVEIPDADPSGPGIATLATNSYGLGAPQEYLTMKMAFIILVHPYVADLSLELSREGGPWIPLVAQLENLGGDVWAGEYDLLSLGYFYEELTHTSTWTLRISDTIVGNEGHLIVFAAIFGATTNPLDPDCDLDGVEDGQEVRGKDAGGVNSDPWKADSDEDGMSDHEERILGTNPNAQDTDADGLPDYDEVYLYPTNPVEIDTDGDSVDDGQEIAAFGLVDTDLDGLLNPVDPDSDGDMTWDGADANPLVYDDPEGNPYPFDSLAVNNDLGVSVAVIYSGSPTPVAISPGTPLPSLPGAIGPHPYFRVTAGDGVANAITQVDLASILPPEDPRWHKLAIYKWNPTLDKWQFQSGGGVNTRHSVWLRMASFSEFGIGDSDVVDSDGDGLTDWEELECAWKESSTCPWNYDAQVMARSEVQVNPGDSFYIHNTISWIQVPSDDITWEGTREVRISSDLIELGFPEWELKAGYSWWVSVGLTPIVTLGTLVNNWGETKQALLSFTHCPSCSDDNAFLAIVIQGTTDILRDDSDGDGWNDGDEAKIHGTVPISKDFDRDGYDDPDDKNPYRNLELSVRVYHWKELDPIDQFDCGDFYFRIYIDGVWSNDLRYKGEYYNPPICEEWEDVWWTHDIPDDAESVDVKIQALDADLSGPPYFDCDDVADVSKTASSGQRVCDRNDMTRTVELDFDLETGTWSGDDFKGDPNGFGRASGEEDGSYGSDDGNDQDDAEVWFDIMMNDVDNDHFGWWDEVHDENSATNPFTDDDGNGEPPDSDGDWMWDYWEDMYSPDPNDPTDCGLNPYDPTDWDDDCDHDGLSNKREFDACTNPLDLDTDGDYIIDGYEDSRIGVVIDYEHAQTLEDRLKPNNPSDGLTYINDLKGTLTALAHMLERDSRLLDYNYWKSVIRPMILDEAKALIADILGLPDGPEDLVVEFVESIYLEHIQPVPFISEIWDTIAAMASLLDAGKFFAFTQEITAADHITCPNEPGSNDYPPGYIYLLGYSTQCSNVYSKSLAEFDMGGLLTAGIAFDLLGISRDLTPFNFASFYDTDNEFQDKAESLLGNWWDDYSGLTGEITLPVRKDNGGVVFEEFRYTGKKVEDDALVFAGKVWQRWGFDYRVVGRHPGFDNVGGYSVDPCFLYPCKLVQQVALEIVQILIRTNTDIITIGEILSGIISCYPY